MKKRERKREKQREVGGKCVGGERREQTEEERMNVNLRYSLRCQHMSQYSKPQTQLTSLIAKCSASLLLYSKYADSNCMH